MGTRDSNCRFGGRGGGSKVILSREPQVLGGAEGRDSFSERIRRNNIMFGW